MTLGLPVHVTVLANPPKQVWCLPCLPTEHSHVKSYAFLTATLMQHNGNFLTCRTKNSVQCLWRQACQANEAEERAGSRSSSAVGTTGPAELRGKQNACKCSKWNRRSHLSQSETRQSRNIDADRQALGIKHRQASGIKQCSQKYILESHWLLLSFSSIGLCMQILKALRIWGQFPRYQKLQKGEMPETILPKTKHALDGRKLDICASYLGANFWWVIVIFD